MWEETIDCFEGIGDPFDNAYIAFNTSIGEVTSEGFRRGMTAEEMANSLQQHALKLAERAGISRRPRLVRRDGEAC
jgi:hypothetical protein